MKNKLLSCLLINFLPIFVISVATNLVLKDKEVSKPLMAIGCIMSMGALGVTCYVVTKE